MRKLYFKLWLIISAVLLSGCYNVSLVYDSANLYTVTAVSASEVEANNLAMSKAVKVCEYDPFKVAVLEHTSSYQGMTAEQKSLVGVASKTIGASAKTTSSNDYKAVIKFRCKRLTADREEEI